MSKVKIEHELLNSKNATFVALLNEIIKWGEANNVDGEAIFYAFQMFTKTSRTHSKDSK